MSKAAKTNNASASPDDTLAFEDALKQLESIVETMEDGDLPLETLLTRYEEGTKLAKICQLRLNQAEVKLQLLEKNAAGELTLRTAEPGNSEL